MDGSVRERIAYLLGTRGSVSSPHRLVKVLREEDEAHRASVFSVSPLSLIGKHWKSGLVERESWNKKHFKYSMSSRGSSGPPLRGYVRNTRRRKMALDVDLNVPPSENLDQEGTSAQANSQDVQFGQQGPSVLPAPIDVEAFDDDVVISSRTAFAEAKINSGRGRNRGNTVVVDVDSDVTEERTLGVASNSRNKRRRVSTNQAIINCDLCINLEGGNNMRKNAKSVEPSPPPPPLPPKEPTFSCPVCIGPLVEEMSTKCGHIFCKSCIKTAIAAQGKCPTCRRKITFKDTIRIYLPATRRSIEAGFAQRCLGIETMV
ncbi:unnamed protein product [Camellia sinensis]